MENTLQDLLEHHRDEAKKTDGLECIPESHRYLFIVPSKK